MEVRHTVVHAFGAALVRAGRAQHMHNIHAAAPARERERQLPRRIALLQHARQQRELRHHGLQALRARVLLWHLAACPG